MQQPELLIISNYLDSNWFMITTNLSVNETTDALTSLSTLVGKEGGI